MEPGLFSVGYAGFWGQAKLSLPAFIAHAGSLGFRAVMLAGKRPHLSPLDWDDASLESLKLDLTKAKVRCAVVAAYVDLTATVAAEVPVMEFQLAYVDSLARLAHRLGASIVRVFTSYESDRLPLQMNWQRTVTVLQEMSDRVVPYGIQLAVQNHHDLAVHTDAMLELLCDVGRANCKLAFDAWSPALRGEDVYAAARKAAAYTILTTNADYVRLPRYRYEPELVNYVAVSPDFVRAVPFGSGFIDYPGFFQGLREGGYEGLAMYEMCSPIRGGGSIDNLDRYSSGYLQWMREQRLTAAS